MQTKIPTTQFPVADWIIQRWSPRSFAAKAIAQDELHTLLEAASWAASANNEQPWEYHYAHRGSAAFDLFFNTLSPGNQPWAKQAAVLLAAVARTTFAANQKPNPWAAHDLGMANATLLLQARSLDIYGHPMAGFDKTQLSQNLQLSSEQDPICVIALGYLASPEQLEEPYKTRELNPRSRKNLSEFSKCYE